ncbi:MAG: hypothetical protein ACW99G_24170 [Candidatus Thorarchaeota archaeon]|jgi:hypothetical protein
MGTVQISYETMQKTLAYFKTCGKKFINAKKLKAALGLSNTQAGMVVRELCEPWTDSKHGAKKCYVIPEEYRQ